MITIINTKPSTVRATKVAIMMAIRQVISSMKTIKATLIKYLL